MSHAPEQSDQPATDASEAAAAERAPEHEPDEREQPPEESAELAAAERDAAEDEERSRALAREAQQAIAAPKLTFRDIDDKRLRNTSPMVPKPNLLVRAFSHLMFRRVAFDERHAQTIRDAGRDGSVVFAMNHHSLLDYLYFNYAFRKRDLPLVWFASRINMIPFRPLWQILLFVVQVLFGRIVRRLNETQLLAYGLERQRPALVFLKRKAIWPWASSESSASPYLKTIIAQQRERIRAVRGRSDLRPMPIRVVPQLLIWSQDPDKHRRGLRATVFGNPDVPGRVRKLINFLLNRRRAFVQLGEPIDVLEWLSDQPEDDTLDELARRLQFEIHRKLTVEERVIKGPILKPAKRIREEILRTREMQAEIARIAGDKDKTREQVEKQMARYLKEMAADFSISYIEFMCISLTVVLDRIYSEVVPDLKGLEGVREAARKGPLILLPCHRSHVDYLVISYLFYANGLIAPHIAAGANLNFFPMGHLFRRSGAFFIRRSFKGNEAYSVVFREYLRKLIREGYWIEFFLEGGRSRTGKMLPPKYGMLRRIVETIQAGAAPDVYFVPIYLGYEQIIEERSYTRELSGEEKKKENITQLLKTTKVLWSRYGRLYVNFGKPFSCREALERMDAVEEGTEEEQSYHVRKLAYQVLDGINDVAMVTPSSATAIALLMHPKRGVNRQTLVARVGFILELASGKLAPLSKTLQHALKIRRQEVAVAVAELEEAGQRDRAVSLGEHSPVAIARGEAVAEVIDETLQRFVNQKTVERHEFDDEIVYTPVPNKRINLDFYKNNIVHLVVDEAILAAAILASQHGDEAPVDKVRAGARFLSQMFKYEFVYDPNHAFEEQFERQVEAMVAQGFVAREGETLLVQEHAQATLELLHQVLAPWVEAYWLLTIGLDQKLREPVSEKDFIKDVQKMARRSYQEGDISCPEAANTVTFKNAIQVMTDRDLIQRTRKGRDTVLALDTRSAEDPQRVTRLADRIKTYFTR